MPESPEEPIDVQRLLMDRAQRLAERDRQPDPRPWLPRLVGFALAVVVVVVVLFAFDRFLASMQRFLGLPVTDPEPSVTEPLPAYVVPAEPGGEEAGLPAAADPPGPDAAPDPGTAPQD